jgi:hypothetical protein
MTGKRHNFFDRRPATYLALCKNVWSGRGGQGGIVAGKRERGQQWLPLCNPPVSRGAYPKLTSSAEYID